MPTAPVAFTLPDPCRVCGGPVTYSGRGRRPTVCSPECRRIVRTDDVRAHRDRRRPTVTPAPATPPSPEVRALAAIVRQQLRDADAVRAARYEDRLDALATPSDFALSTAFGDDDDDAPPFVEVRLTPRGTELATDRYATPRAKDAAARWIAEHYPEALADFPAAL